MKRPRLRITLIDRKGSCPCHHGHKIGDSWDFDTERGQLCPMAMHVAFLYADILRYGGSIPGQPDGTAVLLPGCGHAEHLPRGADRGITPGRGAYPPYRIGRRGIAL